MQTLTVELGDRSYPIHIGGGLLDSQLLAACPRGRQIMIISNQTVAPLYLERLRAQFPEHQVDQLILPDGEQYKDLQHLNLIFDALLAKRHNRTTTLVALGGGVVGDMTGFAAAAYQRGVDFIQVPTTLLSQVDSSVGGKTGVNHPLGKNMIGAFHQPVTVLIDTDVLNTLPERELSAGLAEVIKYGLIYDAEFFDWLEQNMAALRARDSAALTHAIYRACQIKAEVVAQDERETGMRALLNLGHTFGHAIETAQGYGNWLHGEAVGTGMLMAADLSTRLGWMTSEQLARTRALILAAGLPILPPEDMTPAQFMELMAVDKKVMDGRIRLILLQGIGQALVTDEFPAAALTATLSAGATLGQI